MKLDLYYSAYEPDVVMVRCVKLDQGLVDLCSREMMGVLFRDITERMSLIRPSDEEIWSDISL